MSGDFPAKVFAEMPANSEFVIIGNLTMANLDLNTTDVLFHNKTLRSYLMMHEMAVLPQQEKDRIFKIISDDLRDGGKIFGSKIVKEIELENYEEGFNIQNQLATDGKILLKI